MPRLKSRTDDEVVEAAERVLRARGPHAFTLAHVAREIGLSPATLVQRFGTKRGLLVAVGRLAAARAERGGSEGRGLRALRAALLDHAAAHGRRMELVNQLSLLLEDARDDELRPLARRQDQALAALVERHLREAAACGELRVAGATSLAATVLAAYRGALFVAAIDDERPILDVVASVLDPLLASLVPWSPPRRTLARPRRRRPQRSRA